MQVRTTVTALAVLAAAAGAALAWWRGMRDKSSRVVAWQRRLNRDLVNPRQLRTAGQPGVDTAVLRHVGRRSGRGYDTPIGVVPTEDGYVIGLVYGPRTDWLQNLLAAGAAVVVHDGHEHQVDSPRLVHVDDVAGYFGEGERRALRAFGVEQCVQVRRVP